MKKETLVKLIDEEFGDGNEFSWLIDIVIKAVTKNDSRITECTDQYETRFNLVRSELNKLFNDLVFLEKEELKNGVRITHKRVKKGKSNED